MAYNFNELPRQLENQRARHGRIRMPTWDEVEAVRPQGYPRTKNPVRIRWNLV